MKHRPISRTRHADPENPARADAAKLACDTESTTATRPIRWPALIATVGLFGVTTMASPVRPSSIAAASPEPTVTSVNCEGSAASLAAGRASGCSSIHHLSSPTSPLPPSPCRNLLYAAARLLGDDPTWWIVTLIDRGGLVGQTIDHAILERLVQVQTIVRRTNSADPQRTIDLDSLNELIADAASQPCSSAACAFDDTAVDSAADTSAGWYWLCESPSSDNSN